MKITIECLKDGEYGITGVSEDRGATTLSEALVLTEQALKAVGFVFDGSLTIEKDDE